MPFAAFDLHKEMIEAAVADDQGNITVRQRFPATAQAIERFARQHLSPDHALAMEATFNTWAVVRIVRPLVGRIVVSNPLRTRAIAEAKIKTDRIDVTVLIHLLRLDYLPSVWIPDEETQRLRATTTTRASLTSDRTRIKNRIHSVLHQRLIHPPQGDLFSKANLTWLSQLALDPEGRQSLDRQLRLLEQIEQEIAKVNSSLCAHAYSDPRVKLLMTLPGVDYAVADALIATLGDVNRFANADKAAAYFGLTPSTNQSGQHCYHGPITKHGSSHGRWMLIQAAQHAGTHPGPLGAFFRRLSHRRGRNKAVVATARKLVTIAWHMLKNNEPYRYAQPAATEAKLSRLRVRATGEKKKSGTKKGTPRTASYGNGERTRAVPSLDSVYSGEGLPPLTAPKPGEEKMLRQAELEAYAQGVRQARRVPRVSKKKESN
ncbi:MAG: IS110 family transposase [Bryobacteraceae bacterium]